MASRDLVILFEYNAWADRRVLEFAERLTPEQLHAQANMDHGSAFQTLLHLLDVEWSWRLMSAGIEARKLLWEVEPLPDLASISRYWHAEGERILSYVNGLDETSLETEVDFGTLLGQQPRSATVRQILLHVATHSAHHRSEMARRLTECGHSPGDLALMDSL